MSNFSEWKAFRESEEIEQSFTNAEQKIEDLFEKLKKYINNALTKYNLAQSPINSQSVIKDLQNVINKITAHNTLGNIKFQQRQKAESVLNAVSQFLTENESPPTNKEGVINVTTMLNWAKQQITKVIQNLKDEAISKSIEDIKSKLGSMPDEIEQRYSKLAKNPVPSFDSDEEWRIKDQLERLKNLGIPFKVNNPNTGEVSVQTANGWENISLQDPNAIANLTSLDPNEEMPGSMMTPKGIKSYNKTMRNVPRGNRMRKPTDGAYGVDTKTAWKNSGN